MNLIEQQKVRIGTCAWSFDEWSGVFYPEDWPLNRWLEVYARYLSTVEIDSTFYSAPSQTVAQRWMEMTPAHFRFTCKLPREITHLRRLRDCRSELLAFLRALEPLAPKLRVVLIQFPPSYAPREEKSAFRDCLQIFGSLSNSDIPVGIDRISSAFCKNIACVGFGPT